MYETQHNARHTSTQGMPMHGVECVFPKRTDGHALWSKSACMISRFCRVQLFVTLWTRACQAPRSMGFSSQEYWSGSPRPPPGQLPDPGTKSASLPSHALAGRFFFYHKRHPGSPWSKSISFQRKKFFQESEHPRSSRHPNTIFKIKVFIWP